MYNKEALRKLLEDCWNQAVTWYSTLGMDAKELVEDKQVYITSKLSAMEGKWEIVEERKEDWISADDKLPDTEGQYECCKYYKLVTNKEWTYVIYISNFKFFRMRETNEIVIGQDGETGCFSDNLGYAQFPTHWRNIPEPPKINNK